MRRLLKLSSSTGHGRRFHGYRPIGGAALFDFASIDQALHAYRTRFQHGRFAFGPADSLRTVVDRAVVPEAHGVYLISIAQPEERKSVQYIGRSGTLRKDGSLSRQTIRKRLTNRQHRMGRERFFRQYMERHSVEVLEFEWFVTFGGAARVLPALAEAALLQAYFGEHGVLPAMNRSA